MVETALPVIRQFVSNKHCREKDVKKIQGLNYTQIQAIMLLLFNQEDISNVEPFYEIYAINHDGTNLKKIIEVYSQPDSKQSNCVTIQASDYQILLHIYAPLILSMYLKMNDDKRFIFIPVGFGMEGENSAHQTMLCIDMFKKRAYLLDPNGKSTYFDNKIPTNKNLFNSCEPLIESLLCYYFEEFSKLGTNIIFINRKKWNPIMVNINIAQNTISPNGNCVVTSLMISHYLNVAQCDPFDGFMKISNIDNIKMRRCIDGYTKFLCDMCK